MKFKACLRRFRRFFSREFLGFHEPQSIFDLVYSVSLTKLLGFLKTLPGGLCRPTRLYACGIASRKKIGE